MIAGERLGSHFQEWQLLGGEYSQKRIYLEILTMKGERTVVGVATQVNPSLLVFGRPDTLSSDSIRGH